MSASCCPQTAPVAVAEPVAEPVATPLSHIIAAAAAGADPAFGHARSVMRTTLQLVVPQLESLRDARHIMDGLVRCVNAGCADVELVKSANDWLAGNAPGVLPENQDFAEWLAHEMPTGTVIGDPRWWAPRIVRAFERSAPKAEALPDETRVALLSLADTLDRRGNWTIRQDAVAQRIREALDQAPVSGLLFDSIAPVALPAVVEATAAADALMDRSLAVAEEVLRVAAHMESVVQYIDRVYPEASELDRAPIMRNIRRWAERLREASRNPAPKPSAKAIAADFMGGRTVYLDLDGVMADFDRAFPEVFGLDHRSMADDDMWATINSHPSFFLDLPPLPGAIEFFRSIEWMKPVILTACPKSNYAHVAQQKIAWVRAHLSKTCTVLPVMGGRNKPLFMHAKGDVLIDDFGRNTEAWTEAGGTAIKFEGDFAATANLLLGALGRSE